jgi:hypothetical protein
MRSRIGSGVGDGVSPAGGVGVAVVVSPGSGVDVGVAARAPGSLLQRYKRHRAAEALGCGGPLSQRSVNPSPPLVSTFDPSG